MSRLAEILELFADAQSLGSGVREQFVREDSHAGALFQPLASIRKAYQVRNREAGRCRACPRVVATGRRGQRLAYCEKHREMNRQRALRSLGREVAS